ncbi:MAG: hypothetical protein ABI266_04445 [Ginsengibacter sp.]
MLVKTNVKTSSFGSSDLENKEGLFESPSQKECPNKKFLVWTKDPC